MNNLRNQIIPYTDGNHLVAPNLVPPGAQRASDNGVMFTSEYLILLHRTDTVTPADITDFEDHIGACITDNTLHRAPGDASNDAPDDYYGLLAASGVVGLPHVPRTFLWHPWQLIRMGQIQILTLAWHAAQLPVILAPLLNLYAALCILVSCIGANKTDADSRRLAWLLIQGTKKSLLCRLASKVWFTRLLSVFPNGMKDVYALYYQKGHPFIEYMDQGL